MPGSPSSPVIRKPDDMPRRVHPTRLGIGDSLEDLFGAHHVALLGMTGSGKSNLMKYVGQKWNGVLVFWDSQDDDTVPGVTVSSPSQLRTAIGRGAKTIHYRAPAFGDDQKAELELVRRVLVQIGSNLRGSDTAAKTWCLLVIDEVDEVAPLGEKKGPVVWLLKRGRKYGVRCVPASQSPAEVSKAVIKQCSVHIYFKLDSFEGPYFRRYKIPIDEFQWWFYQEPHGFVILHGGLWAPFQPVPLVA